MGVKTSAADEQARVKAKETNVALEESSPMQKLPGFTGGAKNPLAAGGGITEPKRKNKLQ